MKQKIIREKENELSFLKRILDELILLLDKHNISINNCLKDPRILFSPIKSMHFSQIEYFITKIKEGKVFTDNIAKELNNKNYLNEPKIQKIPKYYDDILKRNAIKIAEGEQSKALLDVNT